MSTTTQHQSLEAMLNGAQLPALPQSAIRLLELSQDPKNGPAEFAVPIEADPGLTGQVLKFVNSSYFGFAREISSIKLAITMVGIRTIKNFALWSAVFSLMPNPKCGPFELKVLWQDSLRRGLFARTMGKRLGLKDAEDLFAGALLQDMAIPLLAKLMPKVYEELLAQRNEGRVRLSQLEREKFGWTHAQAAATLARKWNLPEEFAAVVERHADIEELVTAQPLKREQVSVAMSALLPAGADPVWHECQQFEGYVRQLTGSDGAAVELLEQIDKQFAEFAPILKIARPEKSLAERYHEACEAAAT